MLRVCHCGTFIACFPSWGFCSVCCLAFRVLDVCETWWVLWFSHPVAAAACLPPHTLRTFSHASVRLLVFPECVHLKEVKTPVHLLNSIQPINNHRLCSPRRDILTFVALVWARALLFCDPWHTSFRLSSLLCSCSDYCVKQQHSLIFSLQLKLVLHLLNDARIYIFCVVFKFTE